MAAAEPQTPLDYAVYARDRDVMNMVRKSLAAGQAQLAFQPVTWRKRGSKLSWWITMRWGRSVVRIVSHW